MSQFNLTQLLGIFHLQQIFEGGVQNPQELGHLPTPVVSPLGFCDVNVSKLALAILHAHAPCLSRRSLHLVEEKGRG